MAYFEELVLTKMKVLCLNPGPLKEKAKQNDLLVKEGRCMERSGAWANLRMPITLAYISNILKKEGHEVKLIDDVAMQYLRKGTDMNKLLDDFKPDFAVLNTAMQSAFAEDMDNARLIKDKSPNATIAYIGVAPSLLGKEIVQQGPVDIAIRREPEGIIAELAKKIENGEDLKDVKGITYIKDRGVMINPDSDILVDMDKLPYPDYENLPLDAYRTPVDKEMQVLIESSRGCPHRCIYCTGASYYGQKFRARDPKHIVAEIEHVLKLGVRRVIFWADTFTLNKNFVMELCDLMIQKGVNKKFKWIVNSRVNTVDLEMLKKMDEAGCMLMGFGVENGNQEILDYVNKGTKLQDAINAFKWIRQTKIRAAAHIIFGLAPFETKETIQKTIKFVNKLKPHYANFHIATPYPGTKLYEIYNEKGYLINKDYKYLESAHANISLPHLSDQELEYWRSKAFFNFFFRPRIIFQELRMLHSFKELINLAGNAYWFFDGWINAGKKIKKKKERENS